MGFEDVYSKAYKKLRPQIINSVSSGEIKPTDALTITITLSVTNQDGNLVGSSTSSLRYKN